MHLRLDNVWDYTHTHTRTPWSSRPVSHMAISNHGSGLKPVKTYCPAHRPSSVSELWAALGLTFPCFCRARWNLAGGLEAPTNGFVLLQSREFSSPLFALVLHYTLMSALRVVRVCAHVQLCDTFLSTSYLWEIIGPVHLGMTWLLSTWS